MTEDVFAAERAALQTKLDEFAEAIVATYGVAPSYHEMQKLLGDRRFVPYPVMQVFNDDPLQPNEFGLMLNLRDGDPSEGFLLYLHPALRERHEDLPFAIAYQLVVAYGPHLVTHHEAERFGARLMGMDEEAFYQRICTIADSLPPAAEGERV